MVGVASKLGHYDVRQSKGHTPRTIGHSLHNGGRGQHVQNLLVVWQRSLSVTKRLLAARLYSLATSTITVILLLNVPKHICQRWQKDIFVLIFCTVQIIVFYLVICLLLLRQNVHKKVKYRDITKRYITNVTVFLPLVWKIVGRRDTNCVADVRVSFQGVLTVGLPLRIQ